MPGRGNVGAAAHHEWQGTHSAARVLQWVRTATVSDGACCLCLAVMDTYCVPATAPKKALVNILAGVPVRRSRLRRRHRYVCNIDTCLPHALCLDKASMSDPRVILARVGGYGGKSADERKQADDCENADDRAVDDFLP